MLRRVKIENFQCFSDIEFQLGSVNLLAGSNGCGKSSFVHTLLLLRQSVEQGNRLGELRLFGKYIDLGMAKEVLYEDAENDKIVIGIENDDREYIEFAPLYEADKYILKVEKSELDKIQKLNKFNLFSRSFEYISAERITPKNIFSAISFDGMLGKQGENTLSFLEEHGLKIRVEPKLCVKDTEQRYLLYQVNEWLNVLFDGFKLNLSTLVEADAVSLRFQEQGENRVSAPHRAINVGFGITYILPVLVALLKVQKDDFVIIENPEAHLHPKAQRIMGELILRAASVGAQIVLETHSDHILNGIRLGIRKGIMDDSKQVKTFFFTRENIGNRYHVNVYAPEIDREGNLSIWPEGFFDEWDKAMMELF